MNGFEARKILELSQTYTPIELKNNYRRLIKQFHPDKNPYGTCKFIKVREAYEYLNKGSDPIENILKSFNFFKSDIILLKLSPLEYYTGITKEHKILNVCNCFVKCECPVYKLFTIIVPPKHDLAKRIQNFKFEISDERYRIIKNKMTYLFDITLKESLVGFTKTFKDPYGGIHEVKVVSQIVKQNDGYTLKFLENELILLFNVVYPTKLNKNVKKIISELDF